MRYAFVIFCMLPSFGATQDIPNIKLRFVDSYPVSHVISLHGAQAFIKGIEEKSAGKIEVEFYPAQQLGKAADNLRLLQTGVADIASVGPAYVSDKMPLSDVAALPGMFEDICAGSEAYQALATNGLLESAEFQPNGIRSLFAGMQPPYQVVAPRHEINGIADLQGLKIRASGGSSDILVRALGGVPVKLAGPDIREGLDRGTIDANLGPNSSLKPYDIYPLAKFGTQGYPLGSFALTFSISQKAWDQLPPAAQEILTSAAVEAQAELCSAMTSENEKAIAEMEAMGSRFHQATPADLEEVATIATAVIAEWQAALDDRGLPGTQIVEEFRAAIGKSEQ